MASRRQPSRSGKTTLAELGPALAGVGSLLVGVAAVAALLLSRPSEPAGSPSGSVETPNAAGTQTVSSNSADSSVTAEPSAEIEQLTDFAVHVRAIAAESDVPSDPAEYSRYVVVGPRAGMLAEVPASWPDTSITLWRDFPPGPSTGAIEEELGTILIASANEAAINEAPGKTYDVPLLILSASRRLAGEHPPGEILAMRDINYGLECELQATGVIAVAEYVGPYEVYADCGGAKALVVQVELRSHDGSHLVGVNSRIASAADVLALEHGLRTMRIEPAKLLR